ncbi:MAG TPA: hypothetical protein VHB54_05910 [Mucilaginibacter sp.]|nr:hypothetical protein [Mucilaginibacter sp.]
MFKTYKPGWYYDNSGQKISGLIDFIPYRDRIYFKKDRNASSEKISIKDIKAVVIPHEDINGSQVPDSLTVLTEDNKEDKKYFAKFFCTSPTNRFYYKFRVYSSGGTPNMTSITRSTAANPTPTSTITWRNSPSYSGTMQLIMYQDGDSTFELTKKNYVDVLSKAFADVPDLVLKIQDKEFKFKNVNQIFQQYKSQTSYKGN